MPVMRSHLLSIIYLIGPQVYLATKKMWVKGKSEYIMFSTWVSGLIWYLASEFWWSLSLSSTEKWSVNTQKEMKIQDTLKLRTIIL